MPEITSYRDGVPCWLDLMTDDVEAAKTFYTSLFGWDYDDQGPDSGGYQLARLRGRQVAGIGPRPADAQFPSAWTAYLWVDDADAAVEKIKVNGGSLMMEPMDVMDAGRMAIAADPTGAAFGVWEGRKHRGAELANEPGAFTWNECITRDTAGATKFYSSVFGLGLEPMAGAPMDYTLLQDRGRSVAGVMAMDETWPKAVPPHWSNYFWVADADATIGKVTSMGGELVRSFVIFEP